MNLLFSTEYEISISLSLSYCHKLRSLILGKRQYDNIHKPSPSSILLSVEEKDWKLRHDFFRQNIKGCSLMYCQRTSELQFFRWMKFIPGGQVEIHVEDSRLQVVLPPAQWRYFLDSLLYFTEGYWDIFLILPQLKKTIAFASHDIEENDMTKLIDCEIKPSLPFREGEIQDLIEGVKR